MRLISELIQFDIGISTSLYLPAIGTAGLDRCSVNGWSLEPWPPPKMIAKTFLLIMFVSLRIYEFRYFNYYIFKKKKYIVNLQLNFYISIPFLLRLMTDTNL